MSSYVGFANIPNQVHRKSVKRGFEFTLMVAGESGLGKSTLVNSLFLTDLYAGRDILPAKDCVSRTVAIETATVEIEERGVRLRLTVVDTPGFGDSIDCSDNFTPIVDYVNDQFENYLRDESGLNRRNIVDGRIHCCFYFISPSSHGLRPIDIRFLKEIHEKVNVVPVIGKADMLTKTELKKLKSRVLGELKENGIHTYDLPGCDDEEDEEFQAHMKELRESMPYAVVGSNTLLEIKGKRVRCRAYPWGTVEVENPTHCDFSKLRTMLTTCMQDLKEVTQDYHYENYRAQKLSKPSRTDSVAQNGKATIVKDKIDGEKDKDAMLKEKELELQRMQEMIAKMQEQMRLQQQK